MTDDATKAWIQKEEGTKHIIYLDHLGNWTCGTGHLLKVGDKLSQETCDAFFVEDYVNAKADLGTLYAMYSLPPMGLVREAVMLGMLFQMGLTKVRGFKKMLVALMDKNWDRAAEEMLDSKWAKQDTPERAKRAAEMMRTGRIS